MPGCGRPQHQIKWKIWGFSPWDFQGIWAGRGKTTCWDQSRCGVCRAPGPSQLGFWVNACSLGKTMWSGQLFLGWVQPNALLHPQHPSLCLSVGPTWSASVKCIYFCFYLLYKYPHGGGGISAWLRPGAVQALPEPDPDTSPEGLGMGLSPLLF